MAIIESVAPERVRRFQEKVGRTEWPIVPDEFAQAAAAYGVAEQKYGVLEWVNRPACFVIDREGVLRWRHVGRELMDRPALDDVLKQLERL